MHHTLYPQIAPQGIFFESLALRAFHLAGASGENIAQTTANMAGPDLLVGDERLSLKTETGKSTRAGLIKITKLCTTEQEPWEAGSLVERTISHLSRYDRLLMLRAIWHEEEIRYQLIEIPLELLREIRSAYLAPVGRRVDRRSLAGDVLTGDEKLFRVNFDGTDGKCSVSGLSVSRCNMLRQWTQRL